MLTEESSTKCYPLLVEKLLEKFLERARPKVRGIPVIESTES